MITYFCKYTPVELLEAFGEQVRMPNWEVPDFTEADAYIHSSVCTHAKCLLLDGNDWNRKHPENRYAAVFTNCCDSVRRVNGCMPDLSFSFRKVLDLPHTASDAAVFRYAGQLQSLAQAMAARTGRAFCAEKLIGLWKMTADAWESQRENKAETIAVLGARVSDELLETIRETMPLPVTDLTCGGLRPLPHPPEGLEKKTDEEILTAYAKALLTQIPCPRMEDSGRRKELLKPAGIRGIVYHTVKFCDYFSFEYADLTDETALPVVKIESDYTSQASGQLSTRLAALAERMQRPKESGGKDAETMREKKERILTESASRGNAGIYVGLDSGSTTTNAAAIDRDGRLLASVILRTGAKAADAADRALEEIREKLGPDAGSIACVVATGYGRDFIRAADSTVTEISCHAKGAHFCSPEARTIIDIGGQDSKVITLDESGDVSGFVMNDKCAAGTGRFLEMMAGTLELSMDEMSRLGLTWKKDLTITSTCTVFAESEVVSLIAQNTQTADIIHALNKSVASRTVSMVRRVRGHAPFMMTGGVARNAGVVKELEKLLGSKLIISEIPDLTGALGAALYAAEGM